MAEPVIRHPNREKAESKATKAVVVLLLLVSAGMVLLITIGGWSALQGAQPFALVYVFLNLLFAYYVSRWNRGLLTVAAAFAVFYGVLALVAAPSWFARDKPGFDDPALDPGMLGMLTFVLVPIQLLLVVACARAFSQRWNVEVEVDPDDPHGHHFEPPPRGGSAEPLGA
jgi:protein-S-isoprenylcysteine O-methyltransferase Ste14